MSPLTLLLCAAGIAMASTNVMSDSATGLWHYKDDRVSMRLRLADDGTCRVTDKFPGTSMDALCEYTSHGRILVLDWPGIWVGRFPKPGPVRLYFDPVAEVLEVEGETRRVLVRSTGVKR